METCIYDARIDCSQVVAASMADGNQSRKPMLSDCFKPLEGITTSDRWVAQHIFRVGAEVLPRKRMQPRPIATGLEDDPAHVCAMRQVYNFVHEGRITKAITGTK